MGLKWWCGEDKTILNNIDIAYTDGKTKYGPGCYICKYDIDTCGFPKGEQKGCIEFIRNNNRIFIYIPIYTYCGEGYEISRER